MQAVPAQATGHYHERPVAPFLRDWFSAVWVHQMSEAGAPPIVVTPDGTIDLQWIDGRFRIAGPDKEPQTEAIAAGVAVIGFRFQPAAAAAWLGVDAAELLGQRLAIETVLGRKGKLLGASIRQQPNLAELIASLESAIAGHARSEAADRTMQAAHRLIDAGPPEGAPLIPWLARALALSERTLRRRFDESFGYGPKTLDRILRYQRFRRLSQNSRASTAALAAEAGYADQAHLVRETRRLTGSTPARLEQIFAGSS
ncbi:MULTISPECIES: helix-turn-helix domain-containing protein [Phyllobacteriaceae]|jgi:AraC-like DNA-binding protein|uniref:Transcriptional regulator n=1 Tax=Mesorhizobium hungaricum TaxID=1566387 RepID=A0A1C2DIJ9_9HYPH|nr:MULTISPECIES: AraC family transcriptional regulator [Mesorhizobium]MBN9234410.1 helix-turn-helix transcriptional regulator [Mesorhizobium sp.]MDQ0332475.1 AraC-like DNA-binding protein [Mesorhizobium sp. YL-MeA3-2017]OCX14503.1 transcriptional regulator [Mesorhizobium hungaricum]